MFEILCSTKSATVASAPERVDLQEVFAKADKTARYMGGPAGQE